MPDLGLKYSVEDGHGKILYRGPSMNPTLRDGDLLDVRAYAEEEIKCGDVVVFLLPQGGPMIAHRVVAVDSRGLRTRGDNNPHEDFNIVNPSEILGKVECARRGSKEFQVRGGNCGRLIGRVLRIRKRLINAAVFTLRPMYRMPAFSGIFAPLIPQRIRPRVIRFARADKAQLQLLMGKRLIGVLPPGANRWIIKPPFRLFVNEASLPRT
jgi:hypothetical protein